MSKQDQKYIYFFPKISRVEAEGMLGYRTLGTFLFRASSSKIGRIVLSIKQRTSVLHILLQHNPLQGKYIFLSKGQSSSLENRSYSSLRDVYTDLTKKRLVSAGIVNPDHVPNNQKAKEAKRSVPTLGEQGKNALQEVLGAKRGLQDYKMMLRVFIMDKKISSREIKQLAEYRKEHSISQGTHVEMLSALGVSNITWNKYVKAGQNSEDEEDEEEQEEEGKMKNMKNKAEDASYSDAPSVWGTKDVLAWMQAVSKKFNIKDKTISKFGGQDVTGEALLDLDRPMMMQLGITMGQANAVFKAIKSLQV
mmetsp:Transcript_2640/g.4135  ORF Transcript_2640/g.4135 Transcript_2640/m.4135 type:complete len:307 (+) Transcript_2640:62-982(+)